MQLLIVRSRRASSVTKFLGSSSKRKRLRKYLVKTGQDVQWLPEIVVKNETELIGAVKGMAKGIGVFFLFHANLYHWEDSQNENWKLSRKGIDSGIADGHAPIQLYYELLNRIVRKGAVLLYPNHPKLDRAVSTKTYIVEDPFKTHMLQPTVLVSSRNTKYDPRQYPLELKDATDIIRSMLRKTANSIPGGKWLVKLAGGWGASSAQLCEDNQEECFVRIAKEYLPVGETMATASPFGVQVQPIAKDFIEVRRYYLLGEFWYSTAIGAKRTRSGGITLTSDRPKNTEAANAVLDASPELETLARGAYQYAKRLNGAEVPLMRLDIFVFNKDHSWVLNEMEVFGADLLSPVPRNLDALFAAMLAPMTRKKKKNKKVKRGSTTAKGFRRCMKECMHRSGQKSKREHQHAHTKRRRIR